MEEKPNPWEKIQLTPRQRFIRALWYLPVAIILSYQAFQSFDALTAVLLSLAALVLVGLYILFRYKKLKQHEAKTKTP